MSLTLHFHPLSSFCQKVLIGLYELELPFTKNIVDLGNPAELRALQALWPLGTFPVVRDEARGVTVAETSIILEYLDQRCAAHPQLIPADPELARACRLRDRVFDLYVNTTMGKIVTDKLRPEGQHDAFGVEQARVQLRTAYGIAEGWLRDTPGAWAVGDSFTMADCAAAPALFFARKVEPFGEALPRLASYYERLMQRPSVARTFAEAEPYLSMFPG